MAYWTLRSQACATALALTVPCLADDEGDRSRKELNQGLDIVSDVSDVSNIETVFSLPKKIGETWVWWQSPDAQQPHWADECGAWGAPSTGRDPWDATASAPKAVKKRLVVPARGISNLVVVIKIAAGIAVGAVILRLVFKERGSLSPGNYERSLRGPDQRSSLTQAGQLPLGPDGRDGVLVRRGSAP